MAIIADAAALVPRGILEQKELIHHFDMVSPPGREICSVVRVLFKYQCFHLCFKFQDQSLGL